MIGPYGVEGTALRGRALAWRVAAVVPVVAVGVPLLVFDIYALWYWLPALAGDGDEPCFVASCRRPDQRSLWIAGAAAYLPGAACLALSWRRLRRPGRWWPWPVAATGLLLAGLWAVTQIS